VAAFGFLRLHRRREERFVLAFALAFVLLAEAMVVIAYARNWQFQLLAFSIVRLPFLVMTLPLLIIAALALTEYNKRRNARGGSPQ